MFWLLSVEYKVLRGSNWPNETYAIAGNELILLCVFAGVKSVPSIVSTFGKYSGYIKAYGYPVASVLHMQSVYLVVLVTVQRYVAVCLPHRAKDWASLKAVRYETLALAVLTILFYSPRLWQRNIVYDPLKDRYQAPFSKFGASYSFHMRFMVITYYLFIYAIPLSILMFATYQLIRSLKKVKDKKKGMTSSHSKSPDEITLSLVVVVVIFAVCQLANPVNIFTNVSHLVTIYLFVQNSARHKRHLTEVIFQGNISCMYTK